MSPVFRLLTKGPIRDIFEASASSGALAQSYPPNRGKGEVDTMGHLVYGKEEAYQALAERLSRFPIGAVINETLMGILKLLYTETEAAVGQVSGEAAPAGRIVEMTGMGTERPRSGIWPTRAWWSISPARHHLLQ